MPSPRILGLEPLALPQGLTQFNLRADDGQKPRVVPRFLHEITRATPHGFDRHLDASPGGHHDHRKRGIDALDPREQIQPLLT